MTLIEKKMKELIEALNVKGLMVLEIYDPLNKATSTKFYICSNLRPPTASIPQVEITGYDISDIILDTASTFDNSPNFIEATYNKISKRENQVRRSFSPNFYWIWNQC